MLRTIEVEIDSEGRIHALEFDDRLPPGRALLTLLTPVIDEVLGLAEPALAEDWLRPEEDAAWAHLQPDRYSDPVPVFGPVREQTAAGAAVG